MSLSQFDVQGSLLESLGAIAPKLFGEDDKYKMFAQKMIPKVVTGVRFVDGEEQNKQAA